MYKPIDAPKFIEIEKKENLEPKEFKDKGFRVSNLEMDDK